MQFTWLTHPKVDMDDIPRIDTDGGSVVQGNVTTKGDFIGRDKITNIFGLARWQTYLLALAVMLVAAILLIVITPHLQAWFAVATPDPARLQPVSSSHGIEITALAVQQGQIWGGAQQDGKFFLFHSNLANPAAVAIKPLHYTENRILDLHVDCYGNIWLLINEIGTLAYNQATGAISAMLNQQTPGSTLTKNTMYAIASQCNPDGSATIWLGRESVHTLQYEQADLTFAKLRFVPVADDVAFQATQNLMEVRGLLVRGNLVWVADDGQTGQLTVFSPTGMTTPQHFPLEDGLLTLAGAPDGTTAWAGGYQKLFSVQVDQESRSIDIDPSLHMRAALLAVDADYVWLGDDCSTSDNAACCSLAVYIPHNQSNSCVTKQITDVAALAFDEADNLWIGTSAGLFVYFRHVSSSIRKGNFI